MPDKSERDEFQEVERSFLTSGELEKIHTLHRQQLREQLSRSLQEHLGKTRDKVAEEARSRLEDSLGRVLDHFTNIERQLVLALNRVLTGKYDGILADLKERNGKLYQVVQILKDHIRFSTRHTRNSEAKEVISELLMAVIVLVIPATYTFFPQVVTSTALKYVVPTFYVVMVAGLLYWRHTFSKLRKSEAEELERFVTEKEQVARDLAVQINKGKRPDESRVETKNAI